MEVNGRRLMRVWVMSGVALFALTFRAEAAPSRSRPKTKPAVTTTAPTERSAPVGEAKVDGVPAQVATEVVKTEEAKEGVKTYTFGAQEVEGRLRSPQILYFLRRVRAEFEPQPLGHRSFLLELRDTRRHPAL